MNTRNTVKQEAVTRISKILFGCILLCTAGGYAVWAYAQERYDLPPFDQAKAKALSPGKRAEYDRLLFNELTHWSAGSQRHNLDTREAEWREMAADGHELSYLTLTTISPTNGRFSPDQAYARLEELIQTGDAGAMCLYYWVVPNWQDPHYEQAKVYLQRGSDLGHPECQRQLSAILESSAPEDEVIKNEFSDPEQKAYQLMLASAEKGYSAPLNLYLHYKDKGYSKASNVERAHCWATVLYDNFEQDGRNDYFRPDARILREVRDYAAKHHRQDLIELADKLATTRPTLQQCLALENT